MTRTSTLRPGHASGVRFGVVPRGMLRLVVTIWLVAGALAAGPRQAVSAQEPTPSPQDTGILAQDTATLAQDTVTLEEEVEPVTDERALQDEAIRNQLQAVFDRVPDLAGVDVTVDAGVVHLDGTVLRSETRQRAGELAAEMDGVLFLNNRIRESTSLEEQLQPTWSRLRELGYGALAKVPLLFVALLIVALAAAVGAWLGRWGGPRSLHLRNPFLQALLQRVLRLAVIVAGLLLAFDLLNATALIGALVGTAGLAGIALGFAFRDIVENYLAGAILALRQPFEKNDHIRVDTFEGKIVRLTARETIMMTMEGNHVRVPNALILRNPMVNFTRNPLRRLHFDALVAAAEHLAYARETGVDTLSDIDGILRDPPPQALATVVDDATVTMRFTAWVDQRLFDFERVRSEAIRTVRARLEAEGLVLPAPEYVVRLRGKDGAPPPSDEETPLEDAADASQGPPTPSDEAVPPADAPAPSARETTRSAPHRAEKPADLSVDDAVDRQIEEDRRASSEPDLLDRADPTPRHP